MFWIIDQLRTFDSDGTAIEDLVALSAMGKFVQSEFTAFNVEEPEWLGPKLREVRREIQKR